MRRWWLSDDQLSELSKLDTDRFSVAEISTIFKTSIRVSKRICDTAVSQGMFSCDCNGLYRWLKKN